MFTRNFRYLSALLLVWGLLFSSQLHAQNNGVENSSEVSPQEAVPVDGTWTSFTWDNINSFNNEGAFTFLGPGIVDVTDCFVSGDAFTVFNGGQFLGVTEGGTDSGEPSVLSPEGCWASDLYSKGSFLVDGRASAITFQTNQVCSDCREGRGYFRVRPAPGAEEPAPVPVAPIWWLALLSCILGLAGVRKLKRGLA